MSSEVVTGMIEIDGMGWFVSSVQGCNGAIGHLFSVTQQSQLEGPLAFQQGEKCPQILLLQQDKGSARSFVTLTLDDAKRAGLQPRENGSRVTVQMHRLT